MSEVALTKAICVARMPDNTHPEYLSVAVAELDNELEHAGSDLNMLASLIEKQSFLNSMD